MQRTFLIIFIRIQKIIRKVRKAKMKKNTKKLILSLGAFGSIVSMSALSAKCKDTNKLEYNPLWLKRYETILDSDNLFNMENEFAAIEKDETTVEKGQLENGVLVHSTEKDKDIKKPYFIDRSNSYGSWQSQASDCVQGVLLREETLFEPIITKTKEGEWHNLRPSISRYKMELAKKIILVDEDGKRHEFDNDIIDIFPKADGEEVTTINGKKYKTFNKSLYNASSTNEKSINGENFKKIVKEAKSMEIEIVDDVYWVNNKGEKTKYKVCAKDFYYSWLRTNSLGQKVRRKELAKLYPTLSAKELNDKLEEIDKFMFEVVLGKKVSEFTADRKFPNGYLYEVYNTDSSQFFDESKFIVDGRLVFNKYDDELKNQFGLLVWLTANGQDFNAAPSQYIDEVNNKIISGEIKDYEGLTPHVEIVKPDATDEDKQKYYDYLKYVTDEKSLAAKCGTYWYGVNDSKALVATPYYYEGYNDAAREDTFILNEHYRKANPDDPIAVAKEKHMVKKYIIRYKKEDLDDSSFQQDVYNEYKKGNIAIAKSEYFPKNELDTELKLQPTKWGMNYTRITNSEKGMYKYMWQIIPQRIERSQNKLFFNDNYAKLVFGCSNEQIIKNEKLEKEGIYNLFIGKGLVFRTLISGAINWEAYAGELSDQESRGWIAPYAPNVKLDGKGATMEKNEPEDYYNEMNSLYVLDKDLNLIVFNDKTTKEKGLGDEGQEEKYLIHPDSNREKASDNDAKLRLRSAGYDKIKAALKELLDEFYEENKLDPEKDKIEWTIYNTHFKGYVPPKMATVGPQVAEFIKELDPRLNPEFKKATTEPEHNNQGSDSGYQMFAGWGYDYNNIGSGFDGLYVPGLRAMAVFVGQNEDLQDKLSKSFPYTVELAKEYYNRLKELHDKGPEKLGVPLEKWIELSPGELFDYATDYSLEYKYDETKKGLVKAEPGDELIDLGAFSSSFFMEYPGTLTNEQIVRLARELNVYTGQVFEEMLLYPKQKFDIRFDSPYLLTPYTAESNKWIADMLVV